MGPGAVHIPDWLDLDAQVELVARCREWSRGPAGLRTPRMPDGTPLSIRSVCLGWHWYPYAYSRTCDDHDGAPVKPLPADIVALAVDAAAERGLRAATTVRFDASIVNIYDARLEARPAPGQRRRRGHDRGRPPGGHDQPRRHVHLPLRQQRDPHASVDRRRTAQW